MSDNTFHLTFDGPAFQDHEIDVTDLAPALLALGKIVQEANRALNGKRAAASLKMKASREGSFDAMLSIDVSLVQAIGDLIAHPKDAITQAKDLTDLLINVKELAGVGGMGLLALLAWLKGRKADRIDDRGDGTSVIVQGDQTVIVDNRTLILVRDTDVRAATADFGTRLRKIKGLDRVRFDDPGDADREVILERAEFGALDLPADVRDIEELDRTERVEWLKIVTAPFRDGYVWRFSDGTEKTFSAEVRDTDFVRKVANADIALSANDALRCRIEEVQSMTPQGLKKETAVLEVLDYRPGARQLPLI